MADWLRALWANETVREVLRAIAVAVLVCLLGLLGYDVVLDPRNTWRPDPVSATQGTVEDPGAALGWGGLLLGGTETARVAHPIEVVQDGRIAPAAVFQSLECGAMEAVGTSKLAIGSPGDLLCLTNVSREAITISDTGTLRLGADRTLGQHDSLLLWCDGTHWIEVSYSDN